MNTFRGLSITGATPSLRRTIYYLMHIILTLERAPHDTQLRVHFVTLPHIHHLNRTYKRVDRPTDVLTFTPAGTVSSFVNGLLFGDADKVAAHHLGPGTPFDTVHKAVSEGTASSLNWSSCVAGSAEHLPHSAVRSELVELGDIFVSLDYMQRRCSEAPSRSLPLAPYLHAAVVHATLHALGYDHTTPQELRQMVRREQQLGQRIALLSRRCPGYLPPLDVWDAH